MASDSIEQLEREFLSPPDPAKPRVWWHWMGGNVTREGVRADLEWMKRIGIGGVTVIDVAFEGWGGGFDTPTIVEKPLEPQSAAWQEMLRYSVELASRLGLEFSVSSCAGWTQTGGPGVQPHEAMKKLVWSETRLEGGRPFRGHLTKPPDKPGPFQNIPHAGLGAHRNGVAEHTHYRDVAVVAYRPPSADRDPNEEPAITSSAGVIDGSTLSDGDLATAVSLPFAVSEPSWIRFSYGAPRRVHALTAVIGCPTPGVAPLLERRASAWLEASTDGIAFHRIIELPTAGSPQQTVCFAPVTAKAFRVVIASPEPTLFEQLGIVPRATAHRIAQLCLHSCARVNRFEDKAGFSSVQILPEDSTPAVSSEDLISSGDTIDLTARTRADGFLDWTPPAGRWVVARFGFSLTGHTNHPAALSATGLEVDKLNRTHVASYVNARLAEFERAVGAERMGANGIEAMLQDSYEAGAQNWTDDMLEQFRWRRGYDLTPWLPVMTGRVVESARHSDAFLWDFRKTLAELMAEAHYGRMAELLHDRGLSLCRESHECGRAFIGDGMEAKKTADIPMGAIWALRVTAIPEENYDADIRESASVAHLYGKTWVAGESFTAAGTPYEFDPQTLKPIADRALSMGVNRFFISSSPHQPDDRPGPGIGLGPFGQSFTRKETWAELAAPWITYLARSSHLLQQGRFVADIAYLYGEDTNVTSLFYATSPPIPEGYSFDFVNPDALLHELSVKDGKLVTRFGMEYRLLVLDVSTRQMSLPVLRKIQDLVEAGATVVGTRPTSTPSLADDEREFHQLVAQLWTGSQAPCKGGVISLGDHTIPQALSALLIEPDVRVHGASHIRFVHRSLDDAEVYFLSNGADLPQDLEVSFRVTGRAPELWRADSEKIVGLRHRVENERTVVPLRLEANDAVFVVFGKRAFGGNSAFAYEPLGKLAALDGPWNVCFVPGGGEPHSACFDTLRSWRDCPHARIKYFSGTVSYEKQISVDERWLAPTRGVLVDLGTVKNLAEILVNGQAMGVLWRPPFQLDITQSLRPGLNDLTVKVTNLWPNRLIGDQQPGAMPVTSATLNPYHAESPLLESGLLGPVRLLGITAPAAMRTIQRPDGIEGDARGGQ
jgi:alpha-L-rhamnosidase/Glycosyl hydrolases family 2, sugar binding domain